MFTEVPTLMEAVLPGQNGRPEHYPVLEDYHDLLFYIQRNQNLNSVIYEVNLQSGELLNLSKPIRIQWLKYNQDGSSEKQELNYIQQKLAYGYQHKIITNELVQFSFVSYDQMNFYIGKDTSGRYRVYTVLEGANIELHSVYVYAEDFGVFPQVKFIEFFGKTATSGDKFYKKLLLQ
ncbi:MAG: DUF4833 domain-containing protein [Saprospiraceae bacterium]|nr:DUF4833 domain-containing protein [Saprospiraceae bacterium]MBK8671250.1 DUF4833 domain-containing protein [Saprospiraceae bacterium]